MYISINRKTTGRYHLMVNKFFKGWFCKRHTNPKPVGTGIDFDVCTPRETGKPLGILHTPRCEAPLMRPVKHL